MSQTQQCYVCGASGLLVDSRIYVDAAEESTLLLGQCPRCRRYICSRHGEKLHLSEEGRKSWFSLSRRQWTSLVLCCPFDPGVALNDQDSP